VSETIHAGCVAIGGCGVLIAGRSGSGKSDLAWRLIDRGAQLVSDDYTLIERQDGRLIARAPAAIAGRIELRGVGIVESPAREAAQVCLYADLDRAPERLPDGTEPRLLLEIAIPSIGLAALEASAPLKLEQALLLWGLKLP
jgi:serine kinase of HPr protein (carbohydrate metabolism regulator)